MSIAFLEGRLKVIGAAVSVTEERKLIFTVATFNILTNPNFLPSLTAGCVVCYHRAGGLIT